VKVPVFHTRVAGLAVACAVLVALASACGSGTTPSATMLKMPASNGIAAKPPAQILTTAYTAMESAVSVRVYGSIIDSGQQYTLDLTMSPAGVRGSMTAPFDGARLASIDMVLAKGTMYVRSSTLWQQVGGATLGSLLDNRWVTLPASSVASFPFTNAKTFIKLLNSGGGLNSLGKDRVLGVKTTVHGEPAIELSAKGDAVYIATTGQPYPLEIRQGTRNVLDFQYSSLPASITPPPHPLDLSKLEGLPALAAHFQGMDHRTRRNQPLLAAAPACCPSPARR
jgi:hypothetical protein